MDAGISDRAFLVTGAAGGIGAETARAFAFEGEENHTDSPAAKAAMAYGMTRSLKNEIVRLAPRGRVNCVCPGWVMTPMAAQAMAGPSAGEGGAATTAPP